MTPGGEDEPDVIYAGVEPAALFRSEDGGRSFSLVPGLWEHPHRPQWNPGGGGLCLHTVLVHPGDSARLLMAVSAAGVYLSDDGGDELAGRATRASSPPFLPGAPTPEFGQCVHKVARDAVNPERLYLQHHDGIYRSDDGGASWTPMQSIGGVDFGFPVVAHPERGRHRVPDAIAGRRISLHPRRPLHGVAYQPTPAGPGRRSPTDYPRPTPI